MSLTYFARYAAKGELARIRFQRAGVTMRGDALWTDEERSVLAIFKGNYDAMCKRLPHRSRVAIYAQCGKMGLRKAIHFWSAAEVSKLRKIYGAASASEISAAFPHSTWINIRQVAQYHGLRRRGKIPYKLTGFPALDEVRRRCFEIGWTMVDLDQAARTKTYFRKASWTGKKRLNYRALGRAIEALDGVVQAQWRT